MNITDEKIEQLAHLCRLRFNPEEKEAIRNDLEKILGFCQALQQVDTEGVEPLIYLTDTTNNVREDIVIQELSHDEALRNAPAKDSDYFRVPKVISEEK